LHSSDSSQWSFIALRAVNEGWKVLAFWTYLKIGARGMTSTLGWKSEYLSPRRQERKGRKQQDSVLQPL
jgi:hypothetical protein